MKVWVKQWDYAYDMDTNITVWAAELDALKSTCDEIKIKIDGDWDMDDPDMLQYAEEIDNLMDAKKYREAMEKWNEYQTNFNEDYSEFWSIYEQEVIGSNASGAVTSVPNFSLQAPGATCRKCKNPSPDAYADRMDGTYICRQCKIFQGIFSP